MKKVTAILRPSTLEPLKDALIAQGFTGMSVEQIRGYGNQLGWKESYRGHENFVNLIPKIQIVLIVDDKDVEEVIDIICETGRTGEVGDGKIFVSPIDEVIRIRTGERGYDAIH
ncbi:MAG: P-II family nitrogen regulator [Actinomycetaceae bacterium]|nr:P-II family nitrogen regulator [Actinomycetaceae bacterium]